MGSVMNHIIEPCYDNGLDNGLEIIEKNTYI